MIIVTQSLPSRKRMSKALSVAVVLHVAIILGVRFQPLITEPVKSPPLRVTLDTNANRLAPVEPAPEAAANHRGGGNKQATPESPVAVAQRGMNVYNTEAVEEDTREERVEPPPEPAVDEALSSSEVPETESPPAPTQKRRLSATSLMRQARQIAMASAGGRIERANVSKNNSDNHGTSTKFSVREAYIRDWVRKVQQWGNRNFPDEARRGGLTGSLTLSVTLRSDGSVTQMSLMRSSGHDVLDQAAQRIVRLAAPYSPFPESLTKEYGHTLTIKRTWQFLQGSRLASS